MVCLQPAVRTNRGVRACVRACGCRCVSSRLRRMGGKDVCLCSGGVSESDILIVCWLATATVIVMVSSGCVQRLSVGAVVSQCTAVMFISSLPCPRTASM